jgi:hypothetical protein
MVLTWSIHSNTVFQVIRDQDNDYINHVTLNLPNKPFFEEADLWQV